MKPVGRTRSLERIEICLKLMGGIWSENSGPGAERHGDRALFNFRRCHTARLADGFLPNFYQGPQLLKDFSASVQVRKVKTANHRNLAEANPLASLRNDLSSRRGSIEPGWFVGGLLPTARASTAWVRSRSSETRSQVCFENHDSTRRVVRLSTIGGDLRSLLRHPHFLRKPGSRQA